MFCLQGASDGMINPSLACVLPSWVSLFLSPPPSRPLFCCLCSLSCCSCSSGSVCRVGILCQVVPLGQGAKHLFLSSLVSFPSRSALRFISLPPFALSLPLSLPPSHHLLFRSPFVSSCVHDYGTLRTCSAETFCSRNSLPLVLPIFFWSSLFSFHLPFYLLRLCLSLIISQFQAFCWMPVDLICHWNKESFLAGGKQTYLSWF